MIAERMKSLLPLVHAFALAMGGCVQADFTVAASNESEDAVTDSAVVGVSDDSAAPMDSLMGDDGAAPVDALTSDSAPALDTSSHDSAPSIDSARDSVPVDSMPAVDTGPTTCSVDVDGDGYADMNVCKGGLDCDDQDGNAHFGQMGFFGVASLGTKTFDYNCNGSVELEKPTATGVYPEPVGDGKTGTCYVDRTDAWYLKVPGCGETGQWPVSWTYVAPAPLKPASCNVVTEARVQRCR